MQRLSLERPSPLSRSDGEKLLVLWLAARNARGHSFAYFNTERARIKSESTDYNVELRSWNRHINEVLYAGKDETYNANKRAEDAADDELRQYVTDLRTRYPWLSCSWLNSWLCGFNAPEQAQMEQKLDKAYIEALQAWYTSLHSDELTSLHSELAKSPKIVDPAELDVGKLYMSEFMGGIFRVSRRTHKGKRTLGTRYATEEEVRLMRGHEGDGYISPTEGYQSITDDWALRHQGLHSEWFRLTSKAKAIE